MRTAGVGARCYSALLRMYPPQYRARFAGDMLDTLAQDHARVCRRGWWSLILFWIVTIVQAVWFGAAERRGSRGSRPLPNTFDDFAWIRSKRSDQAHAGNRHVDHGRNLP